MARSVALGRNTGIRGRQLAWLAAGLILLAVNADADARDKRWREVKDPHYGEVLFYFYQQKYFSAITYLLSAQVQQRVPRHVDEAELLLGGLYLSYGLHRQAGRIFHRLIDQHATPHVRDRAWFYLAKIWYQRGYFAEAESALARVQRALPRELEEERQVLTGLVLIKRQRYREAADVLSRFRSRTEWAQYARYNMGVALIAAGERDDGVRLLTQVGSMRARSSEMHALKDKANLALGYAFLRVQRAERAHHYLQEVRLQGPFSNKALLGIGWASAARGHYRRALVPWTELHKRNPIDVSVQESLLAVPYALRKLQADQQSLQQYQGAISIYEDEIERLGQTIGAIRAGQLLIPELLGDPGSEAGWFWRIEQLSDTPTNRYLLHLLASHRFQEALKDYRDLLFLARNLRRWSSNMDAFDAMLETRKQAYEERLPRIMQSYRALDLTALVQERDRHAHALARIERTADAMALASSKEQDWLARLHRAKATIDELAATQDVSDYQRKHKLFSGLLRWQISTDYRPRLWQLKKAMRELDRAISEAQKRERALRRAQGMARDGFNGYAERITSLRQRIVALRHEANEVMRAQARYLQELAASELEQQQRRLRTYVTQAKFGIAQIYDQAVSRAEVAE